MHACMQCPAAPVGVRTGVWATVHTVWVCQPPFVTRPICLYMPPSADRGLPQRRLVPDLRCRRAPQRHLAALRPPRHAAVPRVARHVRRRGHDHVLLQHQDAAARRRRHAVLLEPRGAMAGLGFRVLGVLGLGSILDASTRRCRHAVLFEPRGAVRWRAAAGCPLLATGRPHQMPPPATRMRASAAQALVARPGLHRARNMRASGLVLSVSVSAALQVTALAAWIIMKEPMGLYGFAGRSVGREGGPTGGCCGLRPVTRRAHARCMCSLCTTDRL